MNKAYFKIRNYTFPIIPEISYNDMMDGTPDNMSFSFITDENLSDIINIKELCEVEIYNKEYPLVGSIDFNNNTLNVYDKQYIIDQNQYILYGDELVGTILYNENKIDLEDTMYLYNNEGEVFLDNRHHYYMCVSQITSEKMSTDASTGYMNTVQLNEQTILLKNCIRTDIAITPSLYPQLTKTNENGEEVKYNIYDNLFDATTKIVDCHNMCTLNIKIENIDNELISSLKNIPCPNLTYRDLSTYSQLYDVFMRVGRIPYFENGTLYGIKLQGDRSDEIYDLNEWSGLSSIKEASVNDNIYSSKVYNNLYDNETAIVPQIFEDIISNIGYKVTKLRYITVDQDGNEKYEYVDIVTEYDRFNAEGTVYKYLFAINANLYGLQINSIGYPVAYALSEVYQDRLIFHNPIYIDNSLKITIDGTEYEILYVRTNEEYFNVYDGLDTTYASSSYTAIPYKNGVPDTEEIKKWANLEFRKWTDLTSQSENDISKTLLFVRGYDYASKNIEDARAYSIELPYGIELVESIYSCKPAIVMQNAGDRTEVKFGWVLYEYDNDRIIENTLYENLSSLQKRITAYYVKGSNQISNVVCLNVEKGNENVNIGNIFELTDEDYQGAFAWSTTEVYNALRRNFFVVKYKPVMTTMYTNYNYYAQEENKPLSINNFSLPYSQVSDKQVYPVLEYNLEKGLDTTNNIKYITKDINILNLKAGTIVKYNNEEYIINKISTYINNITFECSISLTNNIIQNSIISSYSDTVRVSSLLSAESVVNRSIHLFSENVIRLMDENEDGSSERNTDYTYFTQDIGNLLSMKGLYQIGLSQNSSNTYTYLSKYPFRFDTILQPEEKPDEQLRYYIKTSTGTSEDNNNYITLTDEDFPVTLYQMHYDYVTSGGNVPLRYGLKTVSNTPAELSENIYLYQYYTSTFLGLPLVDHYLRWHKTDREWVDLFPSSEFVPHITVGEELQTSNYRFYYSNKEFNTTNYGTEKMVSTSGHITKIEYSFPTSSYVTNTYLSTAFPDISINSNVLTPQKKIIDDIKVLSCTPVLFNTTQYGCKLAGIGNKEEDFYSLYALPHIYNNAYYLDLRELPRPYIQYKTLFRGSDAIIAKQLSSEIEFMSSGTSGTSVPSYKFMILKIPKFINLDNFSLSNNINDIINNNLVMQVINVQIMTNISSAKITLLEPISNSNEYDYCLFNYISNDETGEIYESNKILKFNIVPGHQVKTLCLRSELYAEL